MRKPHLLPLLVALVLVIAGTTIALADEGEKYFSADLKGLNGSMASGKATFELNKEGTVLHYKVTASNIVDVMMSHIHLAPPGKDGPVAAWLYPPGPPPQLKEGKFEGTLAEGDIKAESLQGDLKGKPLSALIQKIEAGEAYANIHTKAKPGGEVRGQIHK
ncbi:MAG: CHRD domain-containing protein [Deltaproteobacteria bacterium]|nr:CHRD domain-containing protein [Candidatus Deferrimicrobiaceae bacterium]